MTGKTRTLRSGQSTVEFTLVGIPLIFLLISTVEMARGMWNYQNLAYAIRVGARYASIHGAGCSLNGNTCTITVANVANAIAAAAVGLPSGNFNVTLSSATAASVSCAPVSNCFTNTTVWPPSPDNVAGKDIRISATFTFAPVMFFFWPGDGSASIGTYTLGAWTRQAMQF